MFRLHRESRSWQRASEIDTSSSASPLIVATAAVRRHPLDSLNKNYGNLICDKLCQHIAVIYLCIKVWGERLPVSHRSSSLNNNNPPRSVGTADQYGVHAVPGARSCCSSVPRLLHTHRSCCWSSRPGRFHNVQSTLFINLCVKAFFFGGAKATRWPRPRHAFASYTHM